MNEQLKIVKGTPKSPRKARIARAIDRRLRNALRDARMAARQATDCLARVQELIGLYRDVTGAKPPVAPQEEPPAEEKPEEHGTRE